MINYILHKVIYPKREYQSHIHRNDNDSIIKSNQKKKKKQAVTVGKRLKKEIRKF